MLRELRIKNFAVIDQASLEFGSGLNVLTGETGAGKTIVLSALGLILGGRISPDVIRQGENEAAVEALFDSLPQPVRQKLLDEGYGDDDELVIKRIVNRAGKNRVYLNGSLCPVASLSDVGGALIQIYGQHEHHRLLKSDSHLALLDTYGSLREKAEAMEAGYRSLRAAWERLTHAKATVERRQSEEEALRAQLKEISAAQLKVGEEEDLKARKNLLLHAEKLYQGCKEGEEILYEGEGALVSRLGKYVPRLRELALIDPGLNEAVEILNSSLAELEEGASLLRRYADRIEFDPAALEQADDRLAEINRLKRKYGGSIEDILRLGENLGADLDALTQRLEEIPELEREFEAARRAAWQLAETLSLDRRRVAKKFQKSMKEEVRALGMPGTTFEARFADSDDTKDDSPFVVGGRRMSAEGADRVEFYISPNPGEPMKALTKIVSGGELSRVMLAIKALVLGQGEVPTLLFDEVDAGIGGAVAEIVGNKLKRVAGSHQVICVTHLPQIAALASSHYVVQKEISHGRTYSAVKRLEDKERVAELARMLGGVRITEKTKQHAEEMVRAREDNGKRQ